MKNSNASRSPFVSVLLPVHDAGPFLLPCLHSLARQSWTDFEVVAVDDGSRDGSQHVLDGWARSDSRVRVIHRPHGGLVEALNAGLDGCRGEWVARMDADDIAHPRRFELQLEAVGRDPGLDVVSSFVAHFPRPQVAEGVRIYEEWLNGLCSHEEIVRERFIESPLPHPSVMLRRRRLEQLGGYRERGWPEDYDLWLRLERAGARFGKVPRKLLFWRQHQGRLTWRDRRYRVERFLQCKAHHLVRGPLAGGRRLIVWGAGKTGRRLSKHLVRLGSPPEAFIDIDGSKIGRRMRGAPIFAPDELPRLLERGPFVILSCVASRGARRIIREQLGQLGLREGADFWCVA